MSNDKSNWHYETLLLCDVRYKWRFINYGHDIEVKVLTKIPSGYYYSILSDCYTEARDLADQYAYKQ